MRGKKGLELAEKYGLKETPKAINSSKNLDYREIFETAIKESSFDTVVKIIEKADNLLWMENCQK